MPSSATSGSGEAVCGSFLPFCDWLCVAVWSLFAAAPAFWSLEAALPDWSLLEVEAALPGWLDWSLLVELAAPAAAPELSGVALLEGVVPLWLD